jgi:tetratricopeptide (TPR) repeat protein
VVVVDNGSTEDVAYEADQNNLEVLRSDSNLGFAHACNRGIRHTHGDFVVILNNDTIVTPGWLERLLWHMEDDPEIGIAGVSTNFAGSVQQIPVTYRTEKELYDFSENLYSKKLHQRVAVSKVVGVCMLIRRRILEDIGLFDTRFGLGNYEDDDLCLRARVAGYKVVWAKDVFIHHTGSKTFQALDIDYGALLEKNKKKYQNKWAPALAELGGRVSTGGTETDSAGAGLPVFVLSGHGGEQETIESLQAGGRPLDITVVNGRSSSGYGPGIRVLESDGGEVSESIAGIVSRSGAGAAFFVSGGTLLPPEWMPPLERALSDADVGCALAACNLGWDRQYTRPGYTKMGKPFHRFARKNAAKWRDKVEKTGLGFPAAMGVRADILLQYGLPSGFATSAVLLELQRQLADAGLGVVCAKDSYVHVPENQSKPMERETNAVMSLMSARKCLDQNEVENALGYLGNALTQKPDYGEALYERGLLLSLLGREQEAISDFEKALEVLPSDSRAHNNLGCLHFKLGSTGRAETSFKSAIEADPGNWQAKKNLADLYLVTGKSQEATDLYSEIVQQHGDCRGVCASVAEVFANNGDLDTAEQLFKAALRACGEDDAARRGLAAVQAARRITIPEGGQQVETQSGETFGLHDRQE